MSASDLRRKRVSACDKNPANSACEQGWKPPENALVYLLPPGDAWRSFFCPIGNKRVNKILRDSAKVIGGAMQVSFNESAVYYPEELALLGEVFDRVVQSLPLDLRTPHHRTTIARNLLACSLRGERDLEVLERAALMNSIAAAAA
jgi:hypothetical protein